MSIQKKFKADDKVVWDHLGYWEVFFAHTDPKQILTVSHYDDEEDCENNLVFFENLLDADGSPVGVFDWRFRLVESAQELAETPSNQGKTYSQNCVSYKDKEAPVLEENDESGWFKRGELPPVGTVCECQNSFGEWLVGEVIHIGIDLGKTLAIIQTDTEILYGSSVHEFRPIKSPEQVAVEEREKVIQKLVDEAFNEDLNTILVNKVKDIIDDLSSYSVFKRKDAWEKDESKGQKYLDNAVEDNKQLIEQKVQDIITEMDVTNFHYRLEELMYAVVENRLLGKSFTGEDK